MAIDTRAGWLLLATLLVTYILRRALQAPPPYLFFSDLTNLRLPKGKIGFAQLPHYFYLGALLFFALSFIDPHLLIPKKIAPGDLSTPPTEGIAIYLVLDQSGSMAQEVETRGADRLPIFLSKITILKDITKQFIEQDHSDLLGLIAFARVPRVLAPLTLEHSTLLDQLNHLNVVKTTTEDGTALGYAIFKTAHLIAATRYYAQELQKQSSYEIKNTVMIIVTDGLQDPNALDQGNRLRTLELDEAAEYAKSQGIRLYIVNIDPRFASEAFAPHRRQLERITQLTGGQFYLVKDPSDLKKIYTTINQLEKGPFALPASPTAMTLFKRISFYPLFILAGLALLLGGFVLDFVVFRKIP